jgi:class 3 adenylate cyclase
MGVGWGFSFSRYFDQRHRSVTSEMYGLWYQLAVSRYTAYMNIFSALSMLLLIPFDFLLFNNWEFYSQWRIVILALNVAVFLLGSKIHQFNSKILVSVPLIVSVLYQYFLFAGPESDKQIVFLGNLMVVLFCTFLFYKFWRAQYIFNAVGIALSFVLAFIAKDRYQFFLLLGITHALTYVVAFFLRRDFTESMYERYLSLSTMIPIKEAKLISITNDRSELEKNFSPRNRYTVCLCADWRSFQKITKEKPASEVSRYFSVFYDEVYEAINAVSPEGTFYVNWVADELFVVFYDENDDRRRINTKAIEFAHKLVGEVHRSVSAKLGFDLHFDVGVSGGEGLLGLQGPSAQKKTTITGEHPGIAKRLQTMAKLIWQEKKTRGPVLIVESHVLEVSDPELGRSFPVSPAPSDLVKDLSKVKALIVDYDYVNFNSVKLRKKAS